MSTSYSAKPHFLLIELPVFPKGIISLSLPLLAAYLKNDFEVTIHDMNTGSENALKHHLDRADYVGIKVSAQNYIHAKELCARIKQFHSGTPVIWGGELPTLLPDECLKYADTVVIKRIEACLKQFIHDLKSGQLQKIYHGGVAFDSVTAFPDFSPYLNSRYYHFMGLPIETSSGCDKYCNFCMVHTMQKGTTFKSITQIEAELKNIGRQFLNIIDYNLGMNKPHLIALCAAIQQSAATGWMGEMCLESLDDDEILDALSASRCRIIYCGLESIDEQLLKSVNKARTNHPENYKRIINKAQSKGINIASGFIIGLENSTAQTFNDTLQYFISCGLIYVKLTFLTYNPGSYFYKSMKQQGEYLTDAIEKFDGNHLTFLPRNTDSRALYFGTKKFIRNFYSLKNIIRRAFIAEKNFLRKVQFVLFNICYAHVYRSWLKYEVLNTESNGVARLVSEKARKPLHIAASDVLIETIRRLD
jgi:radical SAM superfamily enzyme YgiQ (UPF0313 family)